MQCEHVMQQERKKRCDASLLEGTKRLEGQRWSVFFNVVFNVVCCKVKKVDNS